MFISSIHQSENFNGHKIYPTLPDNVLKNLAANKITYSQVSKRYELPTYSIINQLKRWKAFEKLKAQAQTDKNLTNANNDLLQKIIADMNLPVEKVKEYFI